MIPVIFLLWSMNTLRLPSSIFRRGRLCSSKLFDHSFLCFTWGIRERESFNQFKADVSIDEDPLQSPSVIWELINYSAKNKAAEYIMSLNFSVRLHCIIFSPHNVEHFLNWAIKRILSEQPGQRWREFNKVTSILSWIYFT